MGNKKGRVKRALSKQESLNLNKDTLGIYPFDIFEEAYAVQAESLNKDKSKITELNLAQIK